MREKSVGYTVSMRRDPGSVTDPTAANWIRVTMRKHFWAVGTGARSREVCATAFFAPDGMSETELVERMLKELTVAWDHREL